MSNTIKQETQPVISTYRSGLQVLKRSIIFSFALILLLGGISKVTKTEYPAHVEAAQEPEIVQVVEEPIIEVEQPLEELEIALTWRDNPNGCDTSSQYIREDNLECLDKPKPVKQPVAQSAKKASGTATVSTSYSGNKQTWLAASGIPEAHWWAVDSIVRGESGWNPNAVNRSSGACGLGQQLPCGKWGGDWRDPVKALRDIESYVMGRYGSWSAAVTFRNCTGACWQPVFGKTVYKSHTWY